MRVRSVRTARNYPIPGIALASCAAKIAPIIRLLLCICLVTSVSQGQWLNYPAPGIPRTKDGKPDLTAKTPRTRDGKPDLSGVWHVLAESKEEQRRIFGPQIDTGLTVPGMELGDSSKYARNILLDYKPGEIVVTPEGQALARAARAGRTAKAGCLPYGPVVAVLVAEPQKILQTPGLTVIMLELDSLNRQIYTDGRKLPADPSPSWEGYSVGRWEKDVFVVDTIGFNGKTFLDTTHPVSESMHLTERYHRRDFAHLDVELTFDDRKAYNKPFSVKLTHLLQPDSDVLEYVCNENEKDGVHGAPR